MGRPRETSRDLTAHLSTLCAPFPWGGVRVEGALVTEHLLCAKPPAHNIQFTNEVIKAQRKEVTCQSAWGGGNHHLGPWPFELKQGQPRRSQAWWWGLPTGTARAGK